MAPNLKKSKYRFKMAFCKGKWRWLLTLKNPNIVLKMAFYILHFTKQCPSLKGK